MRDPARIDPIIKKLRQVWKLNPDWRLGQLISNLQGPGPRDVFYPEDTSWDAWLDHLISQSEAEFEQLRADTIQHYVDGLLTYKEAKARYSKYDGNPLDFVLKTKDIPKQNT